VTAKKAMPDWHVPTPTALRLPDDDVVAAHSDSRDLHSGEDGAKRTFSPYQKKSIVAGSRNSAVLGASGALYTWGWNSHDTLGLDTDEEWIPLPRRCEPKTPARETGSSTHRFVAASLGGWHAVAVTEEGQAFAWGGNEYGQAGVHSKYVDERHAGVHVSEHVSVPAQVAFSHAKKITSVSCGGMNSFAIDESGDVYEWGALVGSEREPARTPTLVKGVDKVSCLSAGMFHVLCLTEDRRVFAWGKGDYGQLGLGRPGNWDSPQEITSLRGRGIHFVACGGWHSCALTEKGECFMWGRGEYGRLGMRDDQTDKQRPTLLRIEGGVGDPNSDSPSERIVVDAALGGTHTCFVDARGAAWTVGRNNHGRLGRVVYAKWTGVPGRVVFPPPRGGGEWRCESAVAGGRHTLAVAKSVPVAQSEA